MQNPSWFGLRYPKFQDFEALASSMGVRITYAEIPCGLFVPDVKGVRGIILPIRADGLWLIWELAHEIGHAMQHSGAKGIMFYGKEENQAERWAACALIPESRIRAYGNASEDAMIAAISSHHEDLPLEDCPARRLAAKIARTRLHVLSLEVA